MKTRAFVAFVAVLLSPGLGAAYPGGTPSFQADVAPYCAACHSSRDESAAAFAFRPSTSQRSTA